MLEILPFSDLPGSKYLDLVDFFNHVVVNFLHVFAQLIKSNLSVITAHQENVADNVEVIWIFPNFRGQSGLLHILWL